MHNICFACFSSLKYCILLFESTEVAVYTKRVSDWKLCCVSFITMIMRD